MQRLIIVCGLWSLVSSATLAQVPFSLAMPDVDPAHYELTRFAAGLGFPVGMAALPDGSLVVAESRDGAFFGNAHGTLARLIDADHDGVAESRTVLAEPLTFGGLTSVRVVDDLLFVTGQGKPIGVYRFDEAFQSLAPIGQIDLIYPANWLHRHSALEVRATAVDQYQLYFQVGSDRNMAVTERTATVSAALGPTFQLAGDALHRLTISTRDNQVAVQTVEQLATGLRNLAGMAFDAETGDLYATENGIDGLVDANEPTSADELNIIRAEELGAGVLDFGFPERYVEYRTGQLVGGDQPGVDPWIAFQPLPDPLTGSEAEGPNDLAFVPASFTIPLHGGLVVGMHGRFSAGGLANEENPLVFVDATGSRYDYLIGNDEPAVGHLDGILATEDSIYLADFSPQGALTAAQANSGVIYRLRSKFPAIDDLAAAIRNQDSATRYDVNQDGAVNSLDHQALIVDINHTHAGDANLDGLFDSGDLVQIFARGRYEQPAVSARWSDGDWNGDALFDTLDLIAAFQDGGYEQGPRSVQPVPEPSAGWCWIVPLTLMVIRSRVRR